MMDLPPNEARTIAEYVKIINYWDERDQNGRPRGFILDEQVIQEIPKLHKIIFGTVRISSNKDAGQVYRQPGSGYGLNLGVYFSIAQAAEITFPDKLSSIDMGASQFPDRVVAKAAGIRIDLAGQPQLKSGLYVLDIDTKCDRERTKLVSDLLSNGERRFTDSQVEAKVLEFRYNLRESNAQRAISGAQRAAIKAHYGKLRRKWQLEDFEIPIIIPRLVKDMTAILDTPEGRMMFAAAATGFAEQLAYGGHSQNIMKGLMTPDQPVSQQQIAAPSTNQEIARADYVDTEDEDDPNPDASTVDLPSPADFAEMTRDVRVKLVQELLDSRNPEKSPKKALDQFADDALAKWYEYLLTQPTRSDSTQEDLP